MSLKKKAGTSIKSVLTKDLFELLFPYYTVFCLSHDLRKEGPHCTPNSSTQCLSCAISNLWLALWLFGEALWGITRSWTSWIHHNTEGLKGRRRKVSDVTFLRFPPHHLLTATAAAVAVAAAALTPLPEMHSSHLKAAEPFISWHATISIT